MYEVLNTLVSYCNLFIDIIMMCKVFYNKYTKYVLTVQYMHYLVHNMQNNMCIVYIKKSIF